MIKVLTRNGNKACKTLRDLFTAQGLAFMEQNISMKLLTRQDVMHLFQQVDDPLELISKKSKKYPLFCALWEEETTRITKIFDFLTEHSDILRVPISYDTHRFVIGVDEEKLKVFVPRSKRKEEVNRLLTQLWEEDKKRREEVAYGIHYPRFKICKRPISRAYWGAGQEVVIV